jgi:hypothetical protein
MFHLEEATRSPLLNKLQGIRSMTGLNAYLDVAIQTWRSLGEILPLAQDAQILTINPSAVPPLNSKTARALAYLDPSYPNPLNNFWEAFDRLGPAVPIRADGNGPKLMQLRLSCSSIDELKLELRKLMPPVQRSAKVLQVMLSMRLLRREDRTKPWEVSDVAQHFSALAPKDRGDIWKLIDRATGTALPNGQKLEVSSVPMLDRLKSTCSTIDQLEDATEKSSDTFSDTYKLIALFRKDTLSSEHFGAGAAKQDNMFEALASTFQAADDRMARMWKVYEELENRNLVQKTPGHDVHLPANRASLKACNSLAEIETAISGMIPVAGAASPPAAPSAPAVPPIPSGGFKALNLGSAPKEGPMTLDKARLELLKFYNIHGTQSAMGNMMESILGGPDNVKKLLSFGDAKKAADEKKDGPPDIGKQAA